MLSFFLHLLYFMYVKLQNKLKQTINVQYPAVLLCGRGLSCLKAQGQKVNALNH